MPLCFFNSSTQNFNENWDKQVVVVKDMILTWTILSEQLYSSNFSIKVQIWVQINLNVKRTLKIYSCKTRAKVGNRRTYFLMTMSLFFWKTAKNNNKWSTNGRFWHGNKKRPQWLFTTGKVSHSGSNIWRKNVSILIYVESETKKMTFTSS